ncbi:EAL domain-containing protein [Meiothermus taiwanensis]|uniref:EAL domain-containing protein n=1 Tax=Meiothermus taiwanensis TaxID=172827 RepID=UPI0007B48E25|nr:EAL domain-containing protein [Meiothermus taiwanensis]KZK15744.1 diguanylate cyclase [Meiothermus taiwanensis]
MPDLNFHIKASPGLEPLDLSQGIMVLQTDLEGRFVYANRAYLQYMGLQALPIGASALEHTDPRDVPTVIEVVHRALENPHQTFWVEFSKPTRKPWNRSRWEFMALLDQHGKPVGIQCIGFDISDAYRRARFQGASLELLASGLKETLSPEEVLQRALEAALTVVPVAQAGSATLLQPDGCFRFVAAKGYDLEALQKVYLHPREPLSLSQHIQARVFTQIDIARFNQQLDPERRAIIEGPGRAGSIQAMLATPVVVKGVARAYLYLDHFERPDAFDGLDLRHLEGLARHVAWLLYGNELRQEIQYSRHHDPQTGLLNLYGLRAMLARLSPAPRALLALHCRSLERVRRLEGEATWLSAVQTIARSMQAELRSADHLAFERGIFWLVLEGVDNPTTTQAVLTRLQARVRDQLAAHWPQLVFSPRVGVAFVQPSSSPSELPQAAEMALEQAQPGQVRFYDSALVKSTLEEDWLHQALGQALRPLKSGGTPLGFFLHYQPIRTLEDRRLQHLEALLRWQHPKRGPISPALFLPIAEEEGWMVELGGWVLTEAIARAAQWGIPIAVNLSGSQLEPSLPERIAGLLQRHGLAPQHLILEVTEQVALNETNLAVLRQLARQGHPLYLDDFGSGFSSLERITSLPLAAIKLGQGFVKNLGPNPRADTSEARLMRAVQAIGNSLRLKVIVEGIETEAQYRFLLAEGFSLGQGYLLGRPTAIESREQIWAMQRGDA